MKAIKPSAYILLIGLFVLPIQAQYRAMSPELYLGANAGGNFSTITMMPLYADKAYQMGMNGGLTLRYIAERNFGIQAELNYSQYGWVDDYGYYSNDVYLRKLDFVELPFLMHAYAETGIARFFLNAGPKVAWFIRESEQVDINPTAATLPYYGLPTQTKFQWGVQGGGGFEFHLSKVVIGLEGRYYYGLSDIFHNAVTDPMVTSSLQQLSVSLFCLFQMGR